MVGFEYFESCFGNCFGIHFVAHSGIHSDTHSETHFAANSDLDRFDHSENYWKLVRQAEKTNSKPIEYFLEDFCCVFVGFY